MPSAATQCLPTKDRGVKGRRSGRERVGAVEFSPAPSISITKDGRKNTTTGGVGLIKPVKYPVLLPNNAFNDRVLLEEETRMDYPVIYGRRKISK